MADETKSDGSYAAWFEANGSDFLDRTEGESVWNAATRALLDEQKADKKDPCDFVRGGGGRTCAHPAGDGHRGDHYFECGAYSDL